MNRVPVEVVMIPAVCGTLLLANEMALARRVGWRLTSSSALMALGSRGASC